MAEKNIKVVVEVVDKASAPIKDIGNQVKESKGFIGDLTRGVTDLGSKLKADFQLGANAIKSLTGAFKTSSVAVKGFTAALAATGITIITAAVAALISYFKNFESAAKLVDKALAGVAAVGTQLVKVFQALFSGDFSKAGEEFGKIGSEAIKAADGVDKLYAATNEYEKIANQQVVTAANLRQNIEKNKKILEDETLTYEQRRKALQELNKDTETLGKQELDLATATKARIQAELDNEKNFERQRELRRELAQATAEEINKQTELNNIKDDASKKEREIENKRTEDAKKASEDRIKNEEAAIDKLRELREANILAAITDERKREEQVVQFTEEARMREIDALKVSEKQKEELRKAAQESTRLALEAIDKKYDEKEKEDTKKKEEELANLRKEIRDAEAVTENERRALEIQKTVDYYKKLIEEAKLAGEETKGLTEAQNQAINDLNQKYREEDLQRELAATQAKISINMQYADSVGQVGQILSQLAGENKTLATLGVLIEKASAVSKIVSATKIANAGALATPQAIASSGLAAVPVITANNISAGVGIAAVITSAAQAISQINSAPSPSAPGQSSPIPGATKFAKGGRLRGPSHAQGGILTPFGEVEGGEFIVNKFATQAFLPLLEQINRSNQNGMEPTQPSSMAPQIIKTYVVASEMDSELEKRKKLQDLARL